ncbi:MAG: hypothetical protein ACOYN6_15205 [Ignavibacteria bacterium]
MNDSEANKILEKSISKIIDNPGYGDIKIIIGEKKVCEIISTPTYNLGYTKTNFKETKSMTSMDNKRNINLISGLIKEIQDDTGFGVVMIKIIDHKINTIRPTPLSGSCLQLMYYPL